MQEDNTPKISEDNGRDNKGRFSVGNVGKPKGAVNKSTKDVKDFIVNFLNDKAFELPLIWETLDDKDRASLWLNLSRLVMPKANETEIEDKNIQLLNIDPLEDEY